MTFNPRNILYPLNLDIPSSKAVNIFTDLNNEAAVDKSFELDSMSQDSLNNVQLLRLEVQQLKRQNNFLKRKIHEIQSGTVQPQIKPHKKQSINCHSILKKNAILLMNDRPKENSLSCIFSEIQSILKSLASIHRLQIGKHLWIHSESQLQLLSEHQLSQMSESKSRKEKILRKLQVIALQNQQNQYGALLDVFTQFYRSKTEEQEKIKQKIEKFIEKTLEIGKKLIQGASNKSIARSMRSSYMPSVRKSFNEDHLLFESKNKQNLEQIQLKIKTQRHQVSQSTIMVGNRVDEDHSNRLEI